MFAQFDDTVRSAQSGGLGHMAEFRVMSPNHAKLFGAK
jgi:hypothetical protein